MSERFETRSDPWGNLQKSDHSNIWHHIYKQIPTYATYLWWQDSEIFTSLQFSRFVLVELQSEQFSNTQELLKLLEEIIIPYLKEERQNLNLQPDHWSLLIIDVFSGQMTDPVIQKLCDNHIKLVRVPPNMTHLFQPLDLTVNGAAKSYLKRRFTEWLCNDCQTARFWKADG